MKPAVAFIESDQSAREFLDSAGISIGNSTERNMEFLKNHGFEEVKSYTCDYYTKYFVPLNAPGHGFRHRIYVKAVISNVSGRISGRTSRSSTVEIGIGYYDHFTNEMVFEVREKLWLTPVTFGLLKRISHWMDEPAVSFSTLRERVKQLVEEYNE